MTQAGIRFRQPLQTIQHVLEALETYPHRDKAIEQLEQEIALEQRFLRALAPGAETEEPQR